MQNLRQAFYEIDDFQMLKQLGNCWNIIRDDFLNLNAPLMNIDRIGGKTHRQVIDEVESHVKMGAEYGWVEGWDKDNKPNRDWIQYGLIGFDRALPYIDSSLDRTINLLKEMQGIKVAAFVKLKAGGSLPCHNHHGIFAEGLLQFHLPLVTALQRNYCYLNVDGKFRQYVCGEPIVFDGSFDHFVLNESETDRTILYLEFDKKRHMVRKY